jgi:hypothetical protein
MARKKKIETPKIEDSPNFQKLSLFITIVNHGQADNILRLYQYSGSAAQFTQKGNGTAQKQVLDVLGIEDNRKDVVYCFIAQDKIAELKKELEAYFAANKRNKGIGFSIPLTSIIGAKIYHFLADTLR